MTREAALKAHGVGGAGLSAGARTVLASSAALTLITIAVKVLGYGEKRVLAHLFGAGDDLDVWFLASRVSLLMYFILRGILRPTVVPLLTTARNRSGGEARAVGVTLAGGAALILAATTAAGLILTPDLVGHFAPGYTPAKREACVRVTRMLLPAAGVLSLAYLLTLSLHVRKRFVAAGLGECLQKGFFILGLLALAAPFGLAGVAGAYWTGAVAALLFYLWRHGGRLVVRGAAPTVRPKVLADFSVLAWPLVVGGVASQVGRLIQVRLVSDLDAGSLAALSFAQAAVDLPLILVSLSLSIVLFPFLSDFADRRQASRTRAYLAGAARFLLLVFVPLAAALAFYRESFCLLLFAGGRFAEGSVDLTAQSLLGFAPGLPFFALEMVLVPFFYAHRRMAIPMVAGLVAMAVSLAALPGLRAEFGLAGVSAYLPLARFVKTGLLLACLSFLGVSAPLGGLMRFSARLGLALAPPALGHVAFAAFLPVADQAWPMVLTAIRLGVEGLALTALYAAALHVLGFREVRLTLTWLRRRNGLGKGDQP